MPRIKTRRKEPRRLIFTMAVAGALSVLAMMPWSAQAEETTEITVAMAANPQMEVAKNLIGHFYKKYPNIKIHFVILPENKLRPTVLRDVATGSGQFDVVMISGYSIPIWAKHGWILNLSDYVASTPEWNVDDLIDPIKNVVSWKGDIYGTPFYGSSSFMYYRKDLFKEAGLTMPLHPTWKEIARFAKKLDNPDEGVVGICLRGKPGWGQNLAPLTTVINTFGGRWFNMQWKPMLDSQDTKAAIKFYVNLVQKYGEPNAAASGWQQCLQLFSQGRAAMWYDDTVFAGPVLDQANEEVQGNVGFAFAPTKKTKYSGWLWSWALSIPKTSQHPDAAWKFISWVTSQEYIQLVVQKVGPDQVPPGTRRSTYEIDAYKKAAEDYAELTLKSISHADPMSPTVDPVPYTGVQYVTIPQFTAIGNFVSQQIAGAIAGDISVEKAIKLSERRIKEIMRGAGYYN